MNPIQNENCMMTKRKEMTYEKEFSEKYDLPDYLPDVNRLLRTTARMSGVSHYVSGDMLQFDGTLCYTVLYAAAGGEIASAGFEFPFSGEMPLSDYTEGDEVLFCPRVGSTVCRLQGPRKLTVKTRIKCEAAVLSSACTAPTFSGMISEAERAGMQYRREKILCEACEYAESRGNAVSEDLEIPSAYPPIGEILSVETGSELSEIKAEEHGVSYKGDVLVTVFYMAKEGAGESEERGEEKPASPYYSFSRKVPVYGEMQAQSAGALVGSEGRITVTKAEYRPAVSALGESRTVELDFDYDVAAELYSNAECEVTKDLYSVDFLCSNESVNMPYRSVARTGSFHFSADSAEPNADLDFTFVVSVSSSAAIDTVRKEGAKLVFEGKADVSVILTNGEGLFIGKNYAVPLRAESDAGKTEEPFTCAAECAVLYAGARADAEKIATDLEISVRYVTFNEKETSVVTSAGLCRDKPVFHPRRSDLRFCYPSEGEELWEIAKRYGTTEEALRTANALSGETAGGSKLIIPNS